MSVLRLQGVGTEIATNGRLGLKKQKKKKKKKSVANQWSTHSSPGAQTVVLMRVFGRWPTRPLPGAWTVVAYEHESMQMMMMAWSCSMEMSMRVGSRLMKLLMKDRLTNDS